MPKLGLGYGPKNPHNGAIGELVSANLGESCKFADRSETYTIKQGQGEKERSSEGKRKDGR